MDSQGEHREHHRGTGVSADVKQAIFEQATQLIDSVELDELAKFLLKITLFCGCCRQVVGMKGKQKRISHFLERIAQK